MLAPFRLGAIAAAIRVLINSIVAGDPQFDKVVLLLHGNGANASTTFTDSSPAPKTATAFGNTQISTAQSKFGGASIAFDGALASKMTIPSTPDLEFGSGDGTIEFWMRPAVIPATAGFIIYRPNASGFSNFSISYRSTGKVEAYFSLNNPATNPGAGIIYSVANIALNAWAHIAFVKSGLTYRLFVNGSLDTTVTPASNPPTGLSTVTTMGSDGTFAYNGYIDDLRVTKGLARYTAAFTPPTAAFPDV